MHWYICVACDGCYFMRFDLHLPHESLSLWCPTAQTTRRGHTKYRAPTVFHLVGLSTEKYGLILSKVLVMKFHENPSSSSRVICRHHHEANSRFQVYHLFVSAQKVTSLCDVTNGQAPKSPILNIKFLSGHKFEDLTNWRGKKKEKIIYLLL